MSLVPLTLDGLRQTVATQLEIDASEIHIDDNLFMLGLDSVSLMALVEQWRELGIKIEFIDLVEDPTLADWQQRLNCRPT